MRERLTLPAPAKLNLFLHILGRRADGYHELQTLFQFLDHADELHFAPREDGQIRLHTDVPGVPHDSNLIVRAARQLQEQSGCRLGADIWLDKHLPMGGGIGGGSSDAATTLVGLNHLWQLGWDEDRLAALRGDRLVRTLEVADQPSLERDLRQIRWMLASGLPVEPEPCAPVGSRVRIASGPLAGIEGTVIRRGAHERFVAIIGFLGRGATVDLEDWQVERLAEG